MNITDLMKQYIVAHGVTAAGSIVRNNVPDQPDTIVVISDTGGITPDANDTAVADKQNKTFQVYVRSANHDTALGHINDVRRALVSQGPMKIGDFMIKNVLVISEIQYIGKDATGRWEYTGNFSALVIDEGQA